MANLDDCDLSEICRICTVPKTAMESIFDTQHNSLKLSNILSVVTSTEITYKEELPDKICDTCKGNLINAYNFQHLFTCSEKQIQLILQNKQKLSIANQFPSVKHISFEISDDSDYKDDDSDYKDDDSDYLIIETDERKIKNRAVRKTPIRTKLKPSVSKDLNDKSSIKSNKCLTCSEEFGSEKLLKEHSIKHKEKGENADLIEIDDFETDSYKCENCNSAFADRELLNSHICESTSKNAPLDYICAICSKSFARSYSLKRHALTHSKKEEMKCEVCSKTFTKKHHFIEHMNGHKGAKTHICHICLKTFQQKCTLTDHLRTHSGETPFLCAECGKAFNNSSNLRQHLIRHSGVKSYACNQCPSKFSCKGGLKSHMITHTGQRPFSCDLCGSSFTKSYSLVKHNRIHTGERPYSCDICAMRFNSSDHVKRHMRTHTGEKPYECKYCSLAFAQTNDLVKHLRFHIGDNTYACEKCNESFRFRSQLRAHWKIHFDELKAAKDSENNKSATDSTNNTTKPKILNKLDATVNCELASTDESAGNSKDNEIETYTIIQREDILQHFQQHGINRGENITILADLTEVVIFDHTEDINLLQQ